MIMIFPGPRRGRGPVTRNLSLGSAMSLRCRQRPPRRGVEPPSQIQVGGQWSDLTAGQRGGCGNASPSHAATGSGPGPGVRRRERSNLAIVTRQSSRESGRTPGEYLVVATLLSKKDCPRRSTLPSRAPGGKLNCQAPGPGQIGTEGRTCMLKPARLVFCPGKKTVIFVCLFVCKPIFF